MILNNTPYNDTLTTNGAGVPAWKSVAANGMENLFMASHKISNKSLEYVSTAMFENVINKRNINQSDYVTVIKLRAENTASTLHNNYFNYQPKKKGFTHAKRLGSNNAERYGLSSSDCELWYADIEEKIKSILKTKSKRINGNLVKPEYYTASLKCKAGKSNERIATHAVALLVLIDGIPEAEAIFINDLQFGQKIPSRRDVANKPTQDQKTKIAKKGGVASLFYNQIYCQTGNTVHMVRWFKNNPNIEDDFDLEDDFDIDEDFDESEVFDTPDVVDNDVATAIAPEPTPEPAVTVIDATPAIVIESSTIAPESVVIDTPVVPAIAAESVVIDTPVVDAPVVDKIIRCSSSSIWDQPRYQPKAAKAANDEFVPAVKRDISHLVKKSVFVETIKRVELVPQETDVETSIIADVSYKY